MKLRALAAIAALISMNLSVVVPAHAQAQAQDDDMSYPRLTHCAALNMLLGQVLSVGPDKDEAGVKAQAETYVAQAAALTLVAAAMTQKDPAEVQQDVFAQSGTMAQSLEKEGAAEELLQKDFGTCTDLGKAAFAAVQEAQKS